MQELINPEAPKSPYLEEVSEGQRIAYCACGYSSKGAFCDGSHGAKTNGQIRPMVFTGEETSKKAFCGCRKSNNLPYCDGSHSKL